VGRLTALTTTLLAGLLLVLSLLTALLASALLAGFLPVTLVLLAGFRNGKKRLQTIKSQGADGPFRRGGWETRLKATFPISGKFKAPR
jgi:hypothetical protein